MKARFFFGERYRALKVNLALLTSGLMLVGYLIYFDAGVARDLRYNPQANNTVLLAVDIVCVFGALLIFFNTYQMMVSIRKYFPQKINVIVYVYVFSAFIAFAFYFFLFDTIDSMERGAITTVIATGYWSSSLNPSYEFLGIALVIWAVVLPELVSYVVSGIVFGCALRPLWVSWTTYYAVYLLIKLVVAASAFQIVHGVYELAFGAGKHAFWLSLLVSSASMMVGIVFLCAQTFFPIFLKERVASPHASLLGTIHRYFTRNIEEHETSHSTQKGSSG